MKDRAAHMASIARQMKAAARKGFFDGANTPRNLHYINRCSRVDPVTCTKLIFTHDIGHHTSGWWKNPDYERCFHLSLSPFEPSSGLVDVRGVLYPTQAELDPKLRLQWAKTFYQDHVSKTWIEPAYTDFGKAAEIWHYRLFLDKALEPILPRGEVYSKELTEAGWKYFSEVHAEREFHNEVEGEWVD